VLPVDRCRRVREQDELQDEQEPTNDSFDSLFVASSRGTSAEFAMSSVLLKSLSARFATDQRPMMPESRTRREQSANKPVEPDPVSGFCYYIDLN
jgi:hypothetical protein